MLAKAAGPVLHFPTVLGAVVPVYNIEGVESQIKFTGPILADIFLGKITKWNDPALATINAGVKLPSTAITVVHRSDGSGTTFVWADYLSKVSTEWKGKVGANSSLKWPVGVGGKGNEGVSGLVSQTPASIGYVELVYALQNKISYGAVQNQAGEFIVPEVKSVTAAAAGAMATMPKDFRVSITNSPGAGCLSHLVVHVDSAVRIAGRQSESRRDERLHEVGARRRTEDGSTAWLCPAARSDGPHGARAVEPDQGPVMRFMKLRDQPDFGFRASDGRLCRARARHRGGDRTRALARVDPLDPRVRAQFLGHRHLGSGRARLRCATIHLGHDLFVDSRAHHRGADLARDRHVPVRALSGHPRSR